MITNIYGSTGEIGKKTLTLIKKNYPNIKINLLCANKNYKLLFKQIIIFRPNFVYMHNEESARKLKIKVKKSTRVLSFTDLIQYLNKSKSDLSILSISGYKSLYFLEHIINNTSNLGIANKESIVSAGHIFKKNKFFQKTNIFPLDSEHYSLFNYFNKLHIDNDVRCIILTASGGPFYKYKFNSLKNVSFAKAATHPKWKMGYKNSIDSATLVNKCLEVIEAHYLFDIPFEKIKVLIHPQALVHSIIEKNNYTINMNLFKNDMSIPISNFLNISKKRKLNYNKNLYIDDLARLNFIDVKDDHFPIYKYFKNLDKSKPSNLIKFNVANEFAVNMFKDKLIKYTDIYRIVKKIVSFKLYSRLNNIKDIIKYHEALEKKIRENFNYL